MAEVEDRGGARGSDGRTGLENLIRSASTVGQVRSLQIPHPSVRTWLTDGNTGQQTMAEYLVPLSPWVPMFYPDADMYDSNLNAAVSNPSGQAYIKPFSCLPYCPVYRYQDYDNDNVSLTTTGLLEDVIAAGTEATNTMDTRYLNQKPWVVLYTKGFALNQLKSYLTIVNAKKSGGFSPFQAYSTLATYICGLNLSTKIRTDHMRAWEGTSAWIDVATSPNLGTGVNLQPRHDPNAYDDHIPAVEPGFCEIGLGLAVEAPLNTPGVPDVALPHSPALTDYYFNCSHATTDNYYATNGVLVKAPCMGGVVADEPLIVFTANLETATVAYPNAAVVTIPAQFTLGGVNMTHKKFAMLMAVLQPPMMTVLQEVDYNTNGDNTVRGNMYWAGGTHRIMRPRNYVVLLPTIGTEQSQTVAGRTIYMPRFGSTDVLTVRASGMGAAGTLINAGTILNFPPGATSVSVPASAYIGSWTFSEEDFLAFKDELMSYWKCPEVYDFAVDYLTNHVFSFRRPFSAAPLAIGDVYSDLNALQFYGRGLFAMRSDELEGREGTFNVEGYWTRTGLDHRSRPITMEEVALVPEFDPTMAVAVLAGVYSIDGTSKGSRIHSQFDKVELDKHGVLAWFAFQQSVLFDAAYEALGLPPALLMRGSSYKFDRFARNGVPANELARAASQSQFKQIANELWTDFVDNQPVWGSLYGYFDAIREKYHICPVARKPAAAYKLRPMEGRALSYSATVGIVDYRILFINSCTGVLQLTMAEEEFLDPMEYGILPGFTVFLAAGAFVAAPLSMSSQGVYAPIIHTAMGRKLTYPDVGRRGTELMWSKLPASIVADTLTTYGIRLESTVPGVKGQYGGGDFRPDGADYRFMHEIGMVLMKQLAGMPPRRLASYNDATVLYDNNRVYGRPNIDGGCWMVPITGSTIPVATAENIYSLSALFASRLPTIDSTLHWLYFVCTTDEYRTLLYSTEASVGRPVGLQYLSPTRLIEVSPTDARNYIFVKNTRASIKEAVVQGGVETEKQAQEQAAKRSDPPPELPEIPDATHHVDDSSTHRPDAPLVDGGGE